MSSVGGGGETDSLAIQEIEYPALLQAITNGTCVLVDVRNPDEIQAQGAIPSAINIPLPEVPDAFRNLSGPEFIEKYGFSPDLTSSNSPDSKLIVFSCKSGRRAEAAIQNILPTNGTPTPQIRLYRGSFTDWEAQGGTIIRSTK